jgi:uncharacterized membrane protein
VIEIIPNWHPIFVHFTVALLSLAVALHVGTPLVKTPLKEQWRIVSCWALWFGAALTIGTGISGLYAYNTVAHDTPSHLAMTDHRNWAVITILLFAALAVWSIIRERKKRSLGTAFVVCMVVAGGVLASTAWRGGEVVYRYGLGVMSLPKAEGDGHNQSHGEAHDHGSDAATGTDSGHNDRSEHGHDDEMEMDFSGMDTLPDDDARDHEH